MFWKKKDGRIFISYRRSDSQGFAGRLSDTLEDYFGGNRVFRDIEDITGGAEFASVIENNLHSADAVIVLIGPNWLSATTADGLRRLDMDDDWITQEIAIAIEKGIRLYPVLIEGTPMPRINELPKKLHPLLNYNAITITDRNWYADVLGLGKIISFDIPSSNEKKLYWANISISVVLCASLSFSAAIIVFNYVHQIGTKPPVEQEIIKLYQSGIPFIAISASVIILLNIVNLVAEERRRYIYYSAACGVLGTFFFFCLLLYLNDPSEAIVTFFGSVLVITLMFAFMNMSGFKTK